jgi:hypothetical protein
VCDGNGKIARLLGMQETKIQEVKTRIDEVERNRRDEVTRPKK